MDKKFSNKAVNFFKKEGFYVVLFVCLCVVATVAVLSAKANKRANSALIQQNTQAQEKAKKEMAKANNESSLNYDNALQVKKNSKAEVVVPKSEANSKSVSNSVNTSLDKPVEGSLARAYSE